MLLNNASLPSSYSEVITHILQTKTWKCEFLDKSEDVFDKQKKDLKSESQHRNLKMIYQ